MNCWIHDVIKALFIGILVIVLITPAVANMADDVTNSIAGGIELVLVRLTNNFIDCAVSDSYGVETGPHNNSIALDAIFTIATYTPDPFSYVEFDEMRSQMYHLFFDLWWILVLVAIITFLFLFLFSTNSFSFIYDTTGFDIGHNLKLLLFVLFGGLFIVMLEVAFIWLVLLLCQEVSESVMMGSLNAITFTPDNVVLYTIMGFAYGALWLCFEYRGIFILMFSVICYLLGALLLFPPTSRWAWNMHLYFIQIVFYQVAIIVWYCFCITCISVVPGGNGGLYIIMVLVSIWASYKFIFKLDFIRMGGRVTQIILIKKLK